MTKKALYADYLEDIVDSGEQAIAFVGEMSFDQFQEDRKTVFAVTRAFEIIGEATKQVPPAWQAEDPTRAGIGGEALVDAGRYTNYSARRILNLLKATPRSIPRPVPASASDTSPLVIAVASADGPTPAWADTEA